MFGKSDGYCHLFDNQSFQGIAYAVPFFFVTSLFLMNLIHSNETKYIVTKALVMHLFQQQLLTVEEVSAILSELANHYQQNTKTKSNE